MICGCTHHLMNIPPANLKEIRQLPYHLLLGCFALYVFRFGYGYGTSDQDEFLPYLMHLLDRTAFINDWFVQTQLASFSIRTYFVYLLYIPATVFSPFVSTTFFYALSWFGVASGMYRLAGEITQNRLAAILSVAIALLATPFWTLGGNDLVHSMLVPSMAAWALAVWGLALFFASRPVAAGVLIGLSALFQALVGLQVFLVLFLVTGLRGINDKRKITRLPGELFNLTGPFILCASPALIPLFYQQLFAAPASSEAPSISLFYIMASFRNPHHYLFHSFSLARSIQFALLGIVGLASLMLVRHASPSAALRSVTRILLLIGVICLIAYAGTETFPNLTIAKLQLFKLTVVGKLLLVICLAYACVRYLPSRLTAWLDRLLFSYPLRFTVVLALMYPFLVLSFSARFQSKVYPFSYSLSPLSPLTTWVEQNTPDEAIFATPPSWSHFRTHTGRSLVINHKAFPYKDADIYMWYERLHDMAPIRSQARTNIHLLTQLDTAYEALPMHVLESATEKYGIDYVIRSTALADSTGFAQLEYRNQGWFVYSMSLSKR